MIRLSSSIKHFLRLACVCCLFAGYVERSFAQAVAIEEDFDSVTVPALPAGWSSVSLQGSQTAVTTNTQSQSSPNSVKIPAPNTTSQTAFVTKVYNFSTTLPTYKLYVNFKHKRGMENSWDGGVLEISINGGAFTDVKNAAIGGVFSSGDYNTVGIISGPLSGRPGWTGTAASFENVSLTIPNIPDNANVQLRFVVGTDNSVSGPGWFIDTFNIYPDINTSVVLTPLQNEILQGQSVLVDAAQLNPSSVSASTTVAYLTAPAGTLTSATFSAGTMFQRFGGSTAYIQYFNPMAPLSTQTATFKLQDIAGQGAARFTLKVTADPLYTNVSNAIAFVSSSPTIPGGSLEAGIEFLPFDPCGVIPSPLPIPLAGKIVIHPAVLTCSFGQASLALQSVGIVAAIFMSPPPSPMPPMGEYPSAFRSEAPTPGLSIPMFTYDFISFPLMFGGLGGPGTTTVKLEGANTAELRTLAFAYSSPAFAEPIPSDNFGVALVNVVTDVDGDGTPDIRDGCKNNAAKTSPGVCGCTVADTDSNANGVADCLTSADFKAQVSALQKAIKKLSMGSSSFKSQKAKIKTLKNGVKTVGVNSASSISVSSASVSISKLTKAADKAVTSVLNAKSASSLNTAKQAAAKALAKLLKGIA